MPTYNEYETILYDEGDSIMSMPADTKRDVDKHAAEARRRVTRKRNELTKDISDRWKQRFAEIKAENDQMQKDLAAAHKMVDQMIGEMVGDKYEGLQR